MGTVFLAIAPALILLYFTGLPWAGFAAGLLALGAVWFGGERFVLRHLHRLVAAVQRLGAGDLSSRTHLQDAPGEIGWLARAFDTMAGNLEQRISERGLTEQRSLNQALQQAAVAALGQFALSNGDFSALLNQAAMLVAQTLELEYCRILELLPGGKTMMLQAGVGWKPGTVGQARVELDEDSPVARTLSSGEPVVMAESRAETRSRLEPLLREHGVVSGVNVAIGVRKTTFGVLGVYSARRRIFGSDDLQFLLAAANVIAVAAERHRAEAENQKLAQFASLNPNPVMELQADGDVAYFNQAAYRLALSAGHEHPREVLPDEVLNEARRCLEDGQDKANIESHLGSRVLSWSLHPVPERQVVHCYVTDITERLSLEAQLRQSQKMESVGLLAAGVAHDFNNMLTVIQGHAGLLMARPSLPSELRDSVQAAYFAAERAAGLTRQLLMFSRKGVMQPKLLDLREIVDNMSKMLKRMLGETVALEFSPPAELPLVRADAGMVEQLIMNLAVNARDALAFGGKLIIALQPVEVDNEYVRTHAEARPGSFVFLRVTDTGCGMSAETRNRIFEPFFTTKEPGKGTGLGLATVYGIVKQHEGWIEVSSEVGKGTTFGIFFPATEEKARAGRKSDELLQPVRGGSETILLVEDEAAVLKMGKLILQDCGYRVVEAYSAAEAIQQWLRQEGRVDLLLTDVVMPEGLSGLELAQQLLRRNPDLKIIFSSGYNVNYLDTEFIRKCGGVFLQKPYTRTTLARAVRGILDQGRQEEVAS